MDAKDFATKTQLVEALLACSAMQDRHIRNTIVGTLIKVQGIPRSEVDRVDVASIVDRALDFESGLTELCDVLRFYEGNSVHMQRVDEVYSQSVESPDTTSVSGWDQPSETRRASFNSDPILILISLLLVSLAAIGWLMSERIPDNPSVIPGREDETLILVTNFYLTTGIADIEPHRQIVNAIQKQIKDRQLTDVRVEIVEARLHGEDRDAAKRLANRYNASIIIWGDETSTDLTVQFLNLHQSDYAVSDVTIEADDGSVHKAALANPEPYAQFVTQDLPDQLTFLALFTLAQSEYTQRKYINAINICELAIRYGALHGIQGLEDVYFYLGHLYQHLNQEIDDLFNPTNKQFNMIQAWQRLTITWVLPMVKKRDISRLYLIWRRQFKYNLRYLLKTRNS